MILYVDIFGCSFISNLNDEDEEQNAFNIFYRCEIKCRKVSKNFFTYARIHVSTFLITVAIAFFDICNGNTDTSKWMLSFDVVLPFDTHSTVLGWFLNWLFQSIGSASYVLTVVLTTNHFACFCYYIIATCDYFDLLMALLRFDDEPTQSSQKKSKMGRKAKDKLQLAVEVHIQIYE